MTKFIIKLRTSRYSHAGLQALAQSVIAAMTGNLNYTTPTPTLIAMGALLTDFSDAITAWGPRENRGSHLQHQNLLDTREALETGLYSLANYCENTTPYDKTAFLSGGWEVKREAQPVGLVGPVLNFRQFISRVVPSGAVRLRWSAPAEAPRGSISVYRVMHSLTADINTATQMALTRQTTYTDLDAGTRTGNYYWIISVCVAGNGGIADVVQGFPQGPVVD